MLGPDFGIKLVAAGLGDLPISWGSDGSISGRERLTAEQAAALDAVTAAYDPLPAAKIAKITEAKTSCDAILAPLGAEYGVWERQTWDQQVAEATALMTDPALETPPAAGASDKIPCIRAMASARGMTIPSLAQRILVNRETWSRISGAVIGQRQAVYDRVQAATTLAEVEAIEVKITLP